MILVCTKKFQVHFTVKSLFHQYYVFSDGTEERSKKKKFIWGRCVPQKPDFSSTRKPTKSPYATGLKKKRPLLQNQYSLPKEDFQEHPRGRPRPPRLPPFPHPFLWGAKGPRVEGGVGGYGQAPKEDTVRVGHEAVRQQPPPQKKSFWYRRKEYC